MQPSVKSARTILVLALITGAAWFVWRGPMRAIGGGNFDFALIYSAARAWLLGLDPYSMEVAQRVFLEAGGPKSLEPMTRPESSLVYSPATFLVLAPFAAMPWAAANWAWALANVFLIGVAMVLLARLARAGVVAGMAIAASFLWLAPAATGLYVGQMSHVVLVLILAGELLRRRWQERSGRGGDLWLAGVAIGFAAIIKPQLGLLFLVYELGRLRWRSVAGGLAGIALLLSVGAVRLSVAGIPWWESWVRHMGEFATVGDGNPTDTAHFRYQMINLAYPLYAMLRDGPVPAMLVYAILGALCLAYFIVDLRRGRERGEGHGELLSLSMTACVTLLIAYHRAYDAVILAIPLAMAWRGVFAGRHDDSPHLESYPGRTAYILILVLLLPFLAPGAGILSRAEELSWVPGWLSGTLLWKGVIVPHATWSLLAACVWLIVMRARTGPAITAQSTP